MARHVRPKIWAYRLVSDLKSNLASNVSQRWSLRHSTLHVLDVSPALTRLLQMTAVQQTFF